MNNKNSDVCVIIPYYQTSPEPLIRSINSIFNQSNVATPHIIIVDDSSPIPAIDIINEYFLTKKNKITIVLQSNSGAASARNTGLDHLPYPTLYTAFLDSDDEWTDDHLYNAISVLNNGYDFYFADHQRIDWNTSKFNQLELEPSDFKRINNLPFLLKYNGNYTKDILYSHIIQTSSVVYNTSKMNKIRFPEDLVIGEDEIFWMQAFKLAKNIGFSTKTEVRMGKGVNISQGNTFNTERACELILQNCIYWKNIKKYLHTDVDLEHIKRQRINQLNRNIADMITYRIKHKQALPYTFIAKSTYNNPGWLIVFIKLIKIRFIEKINSITYRP